jgi:hypothetical protein
MAVTAGTARFISLVQPLPASRPRASCARSAITPGVLIKEMARLKCILQILPEKFPKRKRLRQFLPALQSFMQM